MEQRQRKASMVYCSPAGGTEHVAETIRKALDEHGVQTFTANLGKRSETEEVASVRSRLDGNHCLFIGSPVYVSHPVPPVMQFISDLPANAGSLAVPFVTWGGACSGTALLEMSQALDNKGFRVMGAAKILSLHSMMWQCSDPLGAGHPDENDDAMINDLIKGILEKWESGSVSFSFERLAYYPEKLREEMAKHTLQTVRPLMPVREVNEDLCTQCYICSEVCPTDSVFFAPYPEFKDTCICCYNCARECPEEAIEVDLSPMEHRIRERAKQFAEEPSSEIFL